MKKISRHAGKTLILVTIAILLAGCSGELNPTNISTQSVGLSNDRSPITFDDMVYDTGLSKILVPANETGNLFMIDRDTHQVKAVSGFTPQKNANGQLEGITSIASGHNLLYVTNRGAMSVSVVDPSTESLVATAKTMAPPDVVRFVPATNELWVTEEAMGQIEIFSLPDGQDASPVHSGVIAIPDGPESLEVDKLHALAYTNRPEKGLTEVINVFTHNVVKEWGNGCSQARGLALDENSGYLFVACNEGKVVLLDTKNEGAQIASLNFGGDLDLISYNPTLKHLYLPSSASALLAILKVSQVMNGTSASTTLTKVGTADTALGANCVVSDDRNNIWVCDPKHGRIFLVKDTISESSTQGAASPNG
jgi:YVTN family beta-propeller protein